MNSTKSLVYIGVVVAVIAAIAVLPLVIDAVAAARWRREVTKELIGRSWSNAEVRDLIKELREPRGVRGLTRSLIAILIIVLVGFALAYATVATGNGADDLRKTIVTSLLTVLATVAGFYFGSLGSQNSAEAARGNGTSTPTPPPAKPAPAPASAPAQSPATPPQP
jgi:ABC-type glycerol-3-phosphate transport system permease component